MNCKYCSACLCLVSIIFKLVQDNLSILLLEVRAEALGDMETYHISISGNLKLAL